MNQISINLGGQNGALCSDQMLIFCPISCFSHISCIINSHSFLDICNRTVLTQTACIASHCLLILLLCFTNTDSEAIPNNNMTMRQADLSNTFVLWEHLLKKMFSFRHCPNYLPTGSCHLVIF